MRSEMVSGLGVRNTRKCEPQNKTSVIQFEQITTKIVVESMFSRYLLGPELLDLPSLEIGRQTVAAYSGCKLCLLLFSPGVMPCTGRNPAKTEDT